MVTRMCHECGDYQVHFGERCLTCKPIPVFEIKSDIQRFRDWDGRNQPTLDEERRIYHSNDDEC